MAYDALNARLSVTPIHTQDIKKEITKLSIDSDFSSSPSYYEVVINNSTSTTGVQIIDDSDMKEQKIALVRISDVYTFGDLIKWNGDFWLTLIVDNMGDIYKRATIKRCVSSIKWLDEYASVKEVWFTYKTDVSRGLGLNDGNIMILPQERRYILIQNNADTVKINKGKRFIVDNRAWRVTSVDRLQTGLVYLELEEHETAQSKDRLDLRIADYVQNLPPTGGGLW